MKKKLVYIAPHLSTGGMPQYLVKQIESIKDDMDVYCIEWDNVTGGVLVVQRNRIEKLLGDKLITLGEDKTELFSVLIKIKPDIVHLHESPEMFMPESIALKLYTTDRTYTIIETSHDSSFDIDSKQHFPDKFMLVSEHQRQRYAKLPIPSDVVFYSPDKKTRTKSREDALSHLGLNPNVKHVINVGLFTPNKNQGEIFEYARVLKNYPIQFHFIGNQAENFRDYWEPLMRNIPSNCTWWNERDDVDAFYEVADMFLFTSKYETMPLVVLEAASWNIPSLIYNLPAYNGQFDGYSNIEYLTNDIQKNAYRITEKLAVHKEKKVFYTQQGMDDRNTELARYLDNNICATKDDLARLANTSSPNGIGVEIGVLRGDYSKVILENWKYGTVYLIDTWRHLPNYIDMNGQDDRYHYDCLLNTCENIKPWQDRAHIIRMDSPAAAKLFPDEYFDFIYIDADHAYDAVVKDLTMWWPKIKKGGLFCGDDYIPDNGDIWLVDGETQTYAGKFGVRQAVDEFAEKHNLKLYSTTDPIYWKQWYTFKPY